MRATFCLATLIFSEALERITDMITLPYKNHIGGVPYQGPERSWFVVTMKHDNGKTDFKVFAADETSAKQKVCAAELAPARAAIAVRPA